jgi:hypothetical protein
MRAWLAGTDAVRPPHRNYDALKETEPAIAERADEPLRPPPGPAPALKPDAAFLARHELLTQKVAYADALQQQVDHGQIDRGEKAARLSQFDQGDPPTRREARQLVEARELAAAARAHEAVEQARSLERGGPER